MSKNDENKPDAIRFSHVEAFFEAQILCPDCKNYLIYQIGTHDLKCCGCGETYKRPTITLERTASEDYTRPDPNG